ncbi:MAG TPA: chorismate synthase [Peptococcaceae bacterium]|jgi:chorismate synthase|nr:chorismate synthase [Clostridia bacterium]HOB82224.1 chorismate synthase [Peptococcaceae bacterium]HPZ71347.1 chorismate synthase [Peptococcaceae bacterium]HQD54125.1 chorismate synthase [Peptococcaceae bacterium]
MLRFLTAGESHGRALLAVIEGLPAGLKLDFERINALLKRRQGGYGRGQRMALEEDRVEFLSGVRGGKTLGSPLAMAIYNRDWENWQEIMASGPEAILTERMVSRPRPGHADLAGGLKYRQRDMRNILERASARETAVRVAVGAIAEELLGALNIRVEGQVMAIGGVQAVAEERIWGPALFATPLYCPDPDATEAMLRLIDESREKGDSLGGVIRIVAEGLPVGLGSHVQWDRRLDGRLAQAVMSIPAIKGVEIGAGFVAGALPGSAVHDEISYDVDKKRFHHRTNHAGGLEGGMTNGELLVLRAVMKPIPTLRRPLASVDLESKEASAAVVERSDVCAVPAAAVVGEAVTAWVLAEAVVGKFGGDHLEELLLNYHHYLDYLSKC